MDKNTACTPIIQPFPYVINVIPSDQMKYNTIDTHFGRLDSDALGPALGFHYF